MASSGERNDPKLVLDISSTRPQELLLDISPAELDEPQRSIHVEVHPRRRLVRRKSHEDLADV